MRRFISRAIAALMVFAALLLLIFGSKPGTYAYPDGTPVPSDFTIVTYWEKWTKEEAAAMQNIVTRFNLSVGREKKIFVHFVSVSQVDQKTLIATAGGNPPDIAGIWGAQMGTFTSYGALTPLTELQNDGTIGPEVYKPFIWKLCSPGGVPYAASNTPAACALFWNKKIFREAGLDPEHPPQSIDELDAMADRLLVKDSKGDILRAGFLPNFPGWWDAFWGQYFGNQLWDPSTDNYRIDTPEQIKAYTWYQSYSVKNGTAAVQNFGDGFGQFATPQNPFMSGKVAICIQGPWFVNYIENYTSQFAGINFTVIERDLALGKITPQQADEKVLAARKLFAENYGAAFPPNSFGKPGDALVGDLDVWALPKGAKHAKEAMEVLRFFTQQKNMEDLCRSHCKPSPLLKVSEEFTAMHPNPYIQLFDDMLRRPNIVANPVSPNWTLVASEIRNSNINMWKKPAEFPVAPTLKKTQEIVDGYLAEHRKYAAIREAREAKEAAKRGHESPGGPAQ